MHSCFIVLMTMSGPHTLELQESGVTTSEKKPRFRGYEMINPAFTQASVALLESIDIAGRLAGGDAITAYEQRSRAVEPRYLQVVLDWLTIQGYLDGGEERCVYRATEKGRELLQQSPIIKRTVDTYTRIKDVMKWEAGVSDTYESAVLAPVEKSPEGISHFLTALVPAAVSFVHEAYLVDGDHHGKQAGAVLQAGHAVAPNDFGASQNRSTFLQALRDVGVLNVTEDGAYIATERGKKLLQLGGYAELTLSYYEMLQKLHPLMKGEETYGLEGTVNRDPELNARASNGILTIKVAPYIVESLSMIHALSSALHGGGAYIDYGSGGADMLMQVADQGPDTVQRLYGIDINPRTNEEAKKLLNEKGFNGRIELMTGSITDEECLKKVMEQMKAQGLDSGVASINFILHDIGPELSKQFLAAHAEIFPHVPLMITETLWMPLEVCRAYPNYQQSSFQFMHPASGQHLYSEEELRKLLDDCGYSLEAEKVHSSMPSLDGTERLSTIVTWIAKAQ